MLTMGSMDQAVDQAVQAIAAGVGGSESVEEAVVFFSETRARLVPRLGIMRRHKRAPRMSTYVARLVASIDEAHEAGRG